MAISTISLGKVKFNWRGAWTASTAYVKDDVISYGANAYIVKTSHTSDTLFSTNASYFDLMVQGVQNAGIWSNSTQYKLNDIVTYGGAVYIAKIANANQTPANNTTYWTSLVGGFQYLSDYNNSTAYKKGDIVRYGGNNYIASTDTAGNTPTNISYWTLYNTGLSLQSTYSNSTTYKIGEVVTYGANSYAAKQDSTGNTPTNTTYWTQLTSGITSVGTYDDVTNYKPGDLVRHGGYFYLCLLPTLANNPSNTTYWREFSGGFYWQGNYNSAYTYQKGDVVNYNGSSFVSVLFNNLNKTPDTEFSYWRLMMQGSANNVYTTYGDMAYRNNSAIVRLPVGSTGQVLSVSSLGLPVWDYNDISTYVYYVGPNGVDGPNYGSTVGRPFASIQYATQNVQTPCTIYVKAGTYYETLPIVVPANCAVIGDSLRDTFIYPKAAVTTTATYTGYSPTLTQPTYANGDATFASIRTTILASLSSIQDQVITFLNTTSINYNQSKCRRDVGLIINAVLTDLVFTSNYQSTKAGLSYLRSYSSVVTTSQKAQTISGINKARDLVVAATTNATAQSNITTLFAIVTNLINTGVSAFVATNLSYTNPSNTASDVTNAKAILIANRTFIQNEFTAWIAANYTVGNIPGYDSVAYQRDAGYTVDALIFDLLYGGNSQALTVADGYWYGTSNILAAIPLGVYAAAFGRVQTIVQQIVQNQTVTKSAGNSQTQVTNLPVGSVGTANTLSTLTNNFINVLQNGVTMSVSNTSSITVGMGVSGSGFTTANLNKVQAIVDGVTLRIDDFPDTTPSGTLTFTANLSYDAKPVVNNLSTMWYVSDGCMLKTMTFNGMTGFVQSQSDAQDITTATIGGVFTRLNPASPITNKSPYITDCSCFSTGGTGVIIDGSVHASGNKSMVFHAYTNIHDNGVGFWVKDNAKAEIVSCFTYFCYFGYASTGGAKIRALNGNNSYGTYGVVARGYDVTETPITGTIYGNQLTYNSNSLSGNGFSTADTLTGLTSGARASVTNVQSGTYKIYYKQISGTFISGETITGSSTGTSAVIATGGVTGQKGFVLIVTGLTSQPIIGTSIELDGDTSAYVIQSIGTWVNSSSIVQIIMSQEKINPSSDGTIVRIRANFSNARLTGHDFLSIGTGGKTSSNYPGYPLQPAAQGNETVEIFPGRVFFVTTDQDGNFRVGKYFAVNQATGTATLNASAFNLSGLAALRLGSIGAQLGELISEFSSDVTLGSGSNSKVPTQYAVKTYVDSKVNAATQLTLGTSPTQTVLKLTGTGAGTDTVDVQIGGTANVFRVASTYLVIPKTTSIARTNLVPSSGWLLYNTSINALEVYNGSSWVPAGGLSNVNVASSPYNASAFQYLWVDTSSTPITVVLPSSPNQGDEVRVIDVAGTFSTNNLTIGRNGSNIVAQAQDMTVRTNRAGFSLVYYNATQGWLIKDR